MRHEDVDSPSGAMQLRRLGRSGIAVHPIGVGCWAIGGLDWNLGLPMGWGGADDEEARRGIALAVTMGAQLFDTADVYGHGRSERLLGDVLSHHPRSSLVVASKVGYFSGTAANAYLPLHMRHQLEMTLHNLRTDYVDIYFFHNLDFGSHDRYLGEAVAQMRRFREEGLVRAIGMRGPHTYALDRVRRRPRVVDKRRRFLALADVIDPDVIGIRYNMLTPTVTDGFDAFQWAAERDVGVLMYKPFAPGLLLDKHDPGTPPSFPDGDHRARKRWFTADGIQTLHRSLAPIREALRCTGTSDLVRLSLEYCLHRSDAAVVVAGFRTAEQVVMNLSSQPRELSDREVAFIRRTMQRVRVELGDYFDTLEDDE